MAEEVDSNIKQQVDFLVYIKESQTMLEECLHLFKADNSKKQRICLGLLTKIYKLNISISNAINNADGYTVDMLVRPYYETAISLSYLLKNYKEGNFKEFVRTDAMRRRDMLEFFRTSSFMPEEERISWELFIKKSITEDGFEIDQLPKSKTGGSWYRGKTYEHMANNLGPESGAIFQMLYSNGSTVVHPSWSDIKRNHLTPDESGSNKFVPKLEEPIPFYLRYSLLLCLTFGVCENYQRRFGDDSEARATEIAQAHKTFHNRHTLFTDPI